MIINIVIFRIRRDGRVLFVRILEKRDSTAGEIEIKPFHQLLVKKTLPLPTSHPPITP